MVCSATGHRLGEVAGALAGLCDAMTTHGAGVQAFGQDAEGADEQGPQGGADETGADAQDGELLGYVRQVDFVHGM